MAESTSSVDLHSDAPSFRDASLRNMAQWSLPTHAMYLSEFPPASRGADIVRCGEVRLLEIDSDGVATALVHSKLTSGQWYYAELTLGITPDDAGEVLRLFCACPS